MNDLPLRRLVLDACDGPFGSAIKSEHYSEKGARVIRLGNIGTGEWRDDNKAFLSLDYWRQLSSHHACVGDLIMAGLGDAGHPVGRACVVPDYIDQALVKADCYRIRLNPNLADARFIAAFLSSRAGLGQTEALAEGSTRQRLTLSKAMSIRIPQVSIIVQRSVADFLDFETARIDALITKKRHMIELFMARMGSLIDDTVEGQGSRVTLRRLVARITSGPRGWSDRAASTGSLFLRITNVQRNDIELDMSDKLFVDAPNSAEARRVRVRKGDVLVSITADIGSVGIARDDHEGAYVSQHIALLTANGCEPEWLAYSLRGSSAQAWLDGSRYGGTKAQLALEDVAETPIWLPSREEQIYKLSALKDELTRSKRVIDAVRRQIDLLGEHRQALITAAVTGELEISGRAGC